MMNRIKQIIASQKGTTLVELLLGMAISGMILPATVSSMFHMFLATESSQNQIAAVHDIEYAASQIEDDVHKAQTTDLVDGTAPVDLLTLSWVEVSDPSESHSVSYYLSGNLLQRDYDGVTSTVGRYISTIEFSLANGVVKVKMISSPGIDSSGSQEMTYLFALQ